MREWWQCKRIIYVPMLLAAGHTALARVFVPPASDKHTLTSVWGGH